jgi:hypothetical protein
MVEQQAINQRDRGKYQYREDQAGGNVAG